MSLSTEEVEEATILRCLVGSTVHGLDIAGTDDRDEMGICIESPEYVIGLQRFEQYQFRTQPEGVRSGPGDLDLVIYSLRKWVRLALNGNPSMMLLLYVPAQHTLVQSWHGQHLRSNADKFASRRVGFSFLRYMQSQRDRLMGKAGGLHGGRRPELIEKYGFDTKYAGHVVRLGVQGVEFLETGRLTLPMPDPQRQQIRDIRTGGYTLNEVSEIADDLESRLEDLIKSSTLPEKPDFGWADRFLIDAYREAWA